MRRIPGLAALAACIVANGAQAGPSKPLETIAERSAFRSTGRFDEVERLCRDYASTWPDAVRCTEFGRTPEGRPMLALTISRSGALTPEDARERGTPVMLIQGGIHAGEIDGKDAGFLAVRELLLGKAFPDALRSFVLVFVPVAWLSFSGLGPFGVRPIDQGGSLAINVAAGAAAVGVLVSGGAGAPRLRSSALRCACASCSVCAWRSSSRSVWVSSLSRSKAARSCSAARRALSASALLVASSTRTAAASAVACCVA